MSQSVITNAFEQLKAQQAANGSIITLDEFVFANIPGLDTSLPISRDESWPKDGQIVHRQAVGKTGMVNANAVAYSSVLGADVGDFEFNWIGLISSASDTVCMIVHAPLQKKIKTAAGQQGNVLTRSFLMEYSGASEQTAIVTPVDTWQIDFTARLNGVDERIRLENIDIYGAAAFLGDGFKVIKNGDGYSINRGAGYVAGIRANLMANQDVSITDKPVKIWVDVCWRGTLTSEWAGFCKLVVAASLENYISNDEQHYVFAIAEIAADGTVNDLRPLSVSGQLSGIQPKENTFPYFDDRNQLNTTPISDYGREVASQKNAPALQELMGLRDVEGVKNFPEMQISRWRDEGDVRGWGAKGDGVTDDTESFKKAIAAGVNVKVPSGWGPLVKACYIITDTLTLPRGVSIRGTGYGDNFQHPTTLLFKGVGKRQFSIPGAVSTSVANPDAGQPYLADSGTRGNTYKTNDFNVLFSAGIVLDKYSSVENVCVMPYMADISEYQNSLSYKVADDWDVGIWARNADFFHLHGVMATGHWRKAGLLQSAHNIGDGLPPGCGFGRVENCAFQGQFGVSIRTPLGDASTNWGLAGTQYNNCLIRGFYHQSGHLCTSSMLSAPQQYPSGAVEIDGQIGNSGSIRGVQFTNCGMHNTDDIMILTGYASEIYFLGCYTESKEIYVSGTKLAGSIGSRFLSTSNTVSVWHRNQTQYGCDVTPYFSVDDISLRAGGRYSLANEGVFNPTQAIMDDWQEVKFAGSIGHRLRNATQHWNINSADNVNIGGFDSGGSLKLTNQAYSLSNILYLHRTVGDVLTPVLRTYSSGNTSMGVDNSTATFTASQVFLSNGVVRPIVANSGQVGTSTYPFGGGYTQTAMQTTSDRRSKTEETELDTAEKKVAVRLKGLLKKYKLKNAVDEKGQDARWHTGIIAQDVVDAFEKEGLDAGQYAMLCHDVWGDAEAIQEDDGTISQAAIKAGDRYTIRYEELYGFILCAL